MSQLQKLIIFVVIASIVLFLLFWVNDPPKEETEINLGEYHIALLMAQKYKEQADSFQNLYLTTDYGKDSIVYRTKKIFINSQYLPADSSVKLLAEIFAEVDSIRERYQSDSAFGSRW